MKLRLVFDRIKTLSERISQYFRDLFRKYRIKYYYNGSLPKKYEIIRVDTKDINYLQVPFFMYQFVSENGSYIKGGNWDKNEIYGKILVRSTDTHDFQPKIAPLESYIFYKSLKNHFTNGMIWEETELYERILSGEDWKDPRYYIDNEISERSLKRRLNDIDKLYESIKTNGYKTQQELMNAGKTPTKKQPFEIHEIAVNIGRDGKIIFDEGKHRFVIAKILGLSNLPVRVLVRHKKWQEIRHNIYKTDDINKLSNKARRKLGHPDLQDVEYGFDHDRY